MAANLRRMPVFSVVDGIRPAMPRQLTDLEVERDILSFDMQERELAKSLRHKL
jgi:hypothetical protein